MNYSMQNLIKGAELVQTAAHPPWVHSRFTPKGPINGPINAQKFGPDPFVRQARNLVPDYCNTQKRIHARAALNESTLHSRLVSPVYTREEEEQAR